MAQRDEKRKQRELKREIKRAGNKRRRRHLKRELERDPEEAAGTDRGRGAFDFGSLSSAPLNALDHDAKRKRKKKGQAPADPPVEAAPADETQGEAPAGDEPQG